MHILCDVLWMACLIFPGFCLLISISCWIKPNAFTRRSSIGIYGTTSMSVSSVVLKLHLNTTWNPSPWWSMLFFTFDISRGTNILRLIIQGNKTLHEREHTNIILHQTKINQSRLYFIHTCTYGNTNPYQQNTYGLTGQRVGAHNKHFNVNTRDTTPWTVW